MNGDIDDLLRTFVERVQSYEDRLQKWNEVEVKRYLIEPLLIALRWDPADPNFVRHEFPVTMGSDTKKVDYALMSGDTPICVIEAKAGEIDEAASRQALSYARNLNVPWAIVTNGQRLLLYGAEFYVAENIGNALVMDIEFSPNRFGTQLDFIKHLANGTLDSKEVYDIFRLLNERQALLIFLRERKNDLIKTIAKWIEEHWGKGSVDNTSLLSSLEKVFGRVENIEENSTKIQTSSSRLTVVVARDWKYKHDLGKGIFELKSDPTKRIDVSLPGPDVERQLEKFGLRLSSKSAFGSFYYSLRREAGLIKSR
jgi:hypothetical protein